MIKYKKSLGQNFLIDKNICKKIVNLTKIKNKEIIEVGPGNGILTDSILEKKPKKIIIIEKDIILYEKLLKKYENINNIQILNKDALNYNYQSNNKKQIVISNLPYNISIKLIIDWLKMKNTFSEMILMVQKEVADKMNYNREIKKNRLNLLMEIVANFKFEFNVSRNVFIPKPKIMSSVIKIIPKNNIKIDIHKFENFTRKIFQHKRKKLSNVLNKNRINKQLEINLLNKRAEDLNTGELIDLFNKFYNY